MASVAVRGMAGLNDNPLRGQKRCVVHASPDATTTWDTPSASRPPSRWLWA